MSRFPEPQRDLLSNEQKALYDRIAAGPRGAVGGPFEVWLHSPRLGSALEQVGHILRFESGLPPRLVKLVILQTVAFWRSRFAWHRHAELARSMGIEITRIEELRRGLVPKAVSPVETALHTMIAALLARRAVDPADWMNLVGRVGEAGMVNLVAVVGYYGLVAVTLTANDAGMDEPDPFWDREANAPADS